MRTLIGLFAVALAFYAALVLFLALTQSRQVYWPTAPLVTTPAAHGMAFEDVWLATEDGERLHGWWIPAPHQRGVLLFFHGNAGNLSHRIDSIRIFQELGLSVFIVDYRGYGQSSGRPSEHGTYRDARAAWAFLREERGIAPECIVVFGRSLGSAIAAWLAAHERPAAVILESAFTRMPDLAAHLMPWIPVRWLLRFEYNTIDAVAHFESPLLLVHSREDQLVPFAHGEAVFAAAPEPRHFLAIRGRHNDGFLRSRPAYMDGLQTFLDAYLPISQPETADGEANYCGGRAEGRGAISGQGF